MAVDAPTNEAMAVEDETRDDAAKSAVDASLLKDVVVAPKYRKADAAAAKSDDLPTMLAECKRSDGGLFMNRLIKRATKRHKKQQRRVDRKMDAMLDVFGGMSATNEVKQERETEEGGDLLGTIFDDEE